MRWLEARRRRAELVRVVTPEVQRAKVVLGRLLLIRSVGQLRALGGPAGVRDVFPDWTYLPVGAFFAGCEYRKQISVLSGEDRAIAGELGLEPHLALDRDLKPVRQRLRAVIHAYHAAAASDATVDNYKDPDLPIDEQASARRYADLARHERELAAALCALPDDLPDTAVASPVLAGALQATAVRMGVRELGYSSYAGRLSWEAGRWPEWLAAALVRRALVPPQPATGAMLATLARPPDRPDRRR
jgi:hypothetical protein